ncbi:GDSL-type esterase/lipase family protein [Halotalea alkalilenta]|uniref:GDSL-type esterase/lipase family protein n=1 Tax=Halotalea alkalilenta TaxID=376489 RepID=UPI0009DCD277
MSPPSRPQLFVSRLDAQGRACIDHTRDSTKAWSGEDIFQRRASKWLALLLFLLVSLIVTAPLLHAEDESDRPTVMVFGDSLSAALGIEREQGWVNLLSERLGDQYRVVNPSISGETTAGGLERLPAALERYRPEYVLLELGGNDGLQGLPPPQMRANLARMIELIRAEGAQVVLLGIMIPPNYGQPYADAIAGVYPALAQEYAIPYLPFLLDGVALDNTLMQNDGIHPNASAQPQVLDNVWQVLAPLLGEPS